MRSLKEILKLHKEAKLDMKNPFEEFQQKHNIAGGSRTEIQTVSFPAVIGIQLPTQAPKYPWNATFSNRINTNLLEGETVQQGFGLVCHNITDSIAGLAWNMATFHYTTTLDFVPFTTVPAGMPVIMNISIPESLMPEGEGIALCATPQQDPLATDRWFIWFYHWTDAMSEFCQGTII